MKNTKAPVTEAQPMDTVGAAQDANSYVLRLYITGSSPRAIRAIANVRAICEENLAGRYDLEVVDISENPTLAEGEQIIAAPTLIKKLPLPLRRFIGDMSATDHILLGLDLRKLSGAASKSGSR